MAQSDSRGGSNDPVLKVMRRDNARDTSRANADRSSGQYNSASTSWGDKAFMRDLGREGIQRQQEGMREAADNEDYRRTHAAEDSRATPYRPWSRTPAKRTPPKAAAKRK